jgi:hypothetical protein
VCHLLSPTEANFVIEEAERYASTLSKGWSTDRHAQYPTTDFALETCPSLYSVLFPKVVSQIIPTMSSLFDIDEKDLEIDDIFVVKYGGGGQTKLSQHYDNTLLSFSVLFSDPGDFQGGGTRFASMWCEGDETTNLVRPSSQGSGQDMS